MGKYEEWFTGLPWNDGNDPHFNKDGNSLSHWFGDKRHFRPWYDDDSDYNTNAKSYYDYIAYRTRQLDYIIQAINKLLDRNLQVEDTNTVDLEKIGEWLNKEDTETLRAYVKISNQTLNATKTLDDGIYTKDLMPDINQLRADLERVRADLQSKIDNLQAQINQVRADLQSKIDNLQGQINTINNRLSDLENSLNQLRQTVQNNYSTLQNQIDALREQIKQLQKSISINGKIEVPRAIDISNSVNLAKGVELGNVTNSTRISIVATLGSTRLNSIFTVAELKSNAAHIFLTNANDKNDGVNMCEAFTHIIGNKLFCTTVHNFDLNHKGGFYSVHNPWRENNDGDMSITGNTPYYEDVDPEYLAGTGRTRDLLFQSVTVYDQVDPISIS